MVDMPEAGFAWEIPELQRLKKCKDMASQRSSESMNCQILGGLSDYCVQVIGSENETS